MGSKCHGRHPAPWIPGEPWRIVSFVQEGADSLMPWALLDGAQAQSLSLPSNTWIKTKTANEKCSLNLLPFGHSPLPHSATPILLSSCLLQQWTPLSSPTPIPRLFSGFGLCGRVSRLFYSTASHPLLYSGFSNYFKSMSSS